jgi:hypothetical protein
MQKIDISAHLEYGDAKFIAQSTGYSESLVDKVLNGKDGNKRDNDTIIKAAKMVIANRKSLEEQIKIMAEE